MNGTYDKHGLTNTAHNTGGGGSKSLPQQPIPGPENPGPPASMRKALAKKSGNSTTGSGPGLPNRNTSFPGSVR
jgi:hypothetical protein